MKDYCENINEIPRRLCKNCFAKSNLCLFCQGKIEEYKGHPYYIWDELPENCNFKGWVFLKREEIKQKIRRKKEKILSLDLKLKTADGIKAKRLQKEIERHKKEVEQYKHLGSEIW